MQINATQLHIIMPHATQEALSTYTPLINKYSEEFGINSRMQMCHFLAQIAVESNELKSTVENLNYSFTGLLTAFPKYFDKAKASAYQRKPEAIANRVYANRYGNGNEASGDGWRYRGRGLIQITFKDNYAAYNAYLAKHGVNVDLLKTPDLLAQPVGAMKSAMWFFVKSGCNNLALLDTGTTTDPRLTLIRKRINGGTNGLDKAKIFFMRAKLAIK